MIKKKLRAALEKEWRHGTEHISGKPWVNSDIDRSSPTAAQEFPMLVELERQTHVRVSPNQDWQSVEIATDVFSTTLNAHSLRTLAAELLKLANLLDEAQPSPQELWDSMPWQDMDGAPKDGSDVLLKDSDGDIQRCRFHRDNWHFGAYYEETFYDPIAYLPLPKNDESQ